MSKLSQPYFFAFETDKPGKFIAHAVRFETIELDANLANDTTFTLLGADFDKDKRIRQMFDAVKRGKR